MRFNLPPPQQNRGEVHTMGCLGRDRETNEEHGQDCVEEGFHLGNGCNWGG